jgi:hypothetical protein
MDIIEKFLRKVSYKFPKGYPDINDEQDISLIENLLSNLGVDFKFNNLIFEVTDRQILKNTKLAIDYIIQNTDTGF